MTIRTVHQVVSSKGEVVGEYMDLKIAKEMDNRIDVLYYLADIVEAQGVDEVTAEKVAEAMLDDSLRQVVMSKLKSVKNIPGDQEGRAGLSS